jgi:hypothetical protein
MVQQVMAEVAPRQLPQPWLGPVSRRGAGGVPRLTRADLAEAQVR